MTQRRISPATVLGLVLTVAIAVVVYASLRGGSEEEVGSFGVGAPGVRGEAPVDDTATAFFGTNDAAMALPIEEVFSEDPRNLIGQTVKVQGKVREVVGPHRFLLSAFGAVAIDSVLVVLPEMVRVPEDAKGIVATVEGRVERYAADPGVPDPSPYVGQYAIVVATP